MTRVEHHGVEVGGVARPEGGLRRRGLRFGVRDRDVALLLRGIGRRVHDVTDVHTDFTGRNLYRGGAGGGDLARDRLTGELRERRVIDATRVGVGAHVEEA